MLKSQFRSTSRSSRFLSTLEGHDRFYVVMHDNPDPDAIATGWAIKVLIEESGLPGPVRLLGGGAIVRAENRHMVELLMPPIQLVNCIQVPENTATVLVDCGLGTTNQLLTRAAIQPVAVIDHHENVEVANVPFYDIRPALAASSTIAASYLREQHVEPGVRLATALLYAIHTETRGTETQYSRLDRSILLWLTKRADPALVAEIENAPLSRSYFRDLTLAMQNTRLYGDAALCLLPRASGAEIVGEVADLLIRGEGIRRVLCAAVIGADVILSARTERDAENAAQLIVRTLRGIGGGGGHEHRAGGKISDIARGGRFDDYLQTVLKNRWLDACDLPANTPGVWLVEEASANR